MNGKYVSSGVPGTLPQRTKRTSRVARKKTFKGYTFTNVQAGTLTGTTAGQCILLAHCTFTSAVINYCVASALWKYVLNKCGTNITDDLQIAASDGISAGSILTIRWFTSATFSPVNFTVTAGALTHGQIIDNIRNFLNTNSGTLGFGIRKVSLDGSTVNNAVNLNGTNLRINIGALSLLKFKNKTTATTNIESTDTANLKIRKIITYSNHLDNVNKTLLDYIVPTEAMMFRATTSGTVADQTDLPGLSQFHNAKRTSLFSVGIGGTSADTLKSSMSKKINELFDMNAGSGAAIDTDSFEGGTSSFLFMQNHIFFAAQLVNVDWQVNKYFRTEMYGGGIEITGQQQRIALP